MEYGSIEREIHIEATPEVVYEVISTAGHLREWWPDEAELEPVPGATGVISFGDRSTPEAKVAPLTVMEADPPRRFSFRWVYDEGETASSANSPWGPLELFPWVAAPLLRSPEGGSRERGWRAAVLGEHSRQPVPGWDSFLPRLVLYVARLVSTP